jgi:branched-subunit amino acid transport protein
VIWLIMLGAGALTYGIRLSMLVFVHHSALPPASRDALRYVTPAVLAAIILPAVLYVGHPARFDAGIGNERLLAAALAAVVAWLGRGIYLTIGAGMLALWILQAL